MTMKNGTLVMLIKVGKLKWRGAPSVGACGEVVSFGTAYPDCYDVHFPHSPVHVWHCTRCAIVPISDPDADVCEDTEKFVEVCEELQ